MSQTIGLKLNHTFIHTSIKNPSVDPKFDVDSHLRQVPQINVVNNIEDISAQTNKLKPNKIKAITIDSLLAKTELRHMPDVAEESRAETHKNNPDFFSESEDQD